VLAYAVLRAWPREYAGGSWRAWHEVATEGGVILLASLFAYCWFLPTPGYNLLSTWAATAGSGMLLAGLDAMRSIPRRGSWWLAGAGACAGVLFFTKAPAAVALGVLYAAALVTWPLPASGARTQCAAAIAAGCVVVAGAFFVFAQSPPVWWRFFRAGVVQASLTTGVSRSALLHRHVQQTWEDIVLAAARQRWPIWLALAALAAVGPLVRMARRGRALIDVGVSAALLYALADSAWYVFGYDKRFVQFDVARFCFGWLVIAALAIAALRPPLARPDRLRDTVRIGIVIAVLLAALPFVTAAGTQNYFSVTMMYMMAPWLALLVLMLRAISAPPHRRWIAQVTLASLAVASAGQVTLGAWHGPYRLIPPLSTQVVPTDIGEPATRLKLDAGGHEFFVRLRAMARENGFRPGDDVLAFLDAPGAVFALGARSPGSPWYVGGYSGSDAVNAMRLAAIGRTRAAHAFLLESDSARTWLQTTKLVGVDFPRAYVLCGELRIPYAWTKDRVRLWRPLAARPD